MITFSKVFVSPNRTHAVMPIYDNGKFCCTLSALVGQAIRLRPSIMSQSGQPLIEIPAVAYQNIRNALAGKVS